MKDSLKSPPTFVALSIFLVVSWSASTALVPLTMLSYELSPAPKCSGAQLCLTPPSLNLPKIAFGNESLDTYSGYKRPSGLSFYPASQNTFTADQNITMFHLDKTAFRTTGTSNHNQQYNLYQD